MTAVALTIAGSDPSGGAGIQADLKTFHQFGVFGTAVITLLTVQNTVAVSRVEVLARDLVREQMEAVFADLPVAAVKTGALGDIDIVEEVAAAAKNFSVPLVVDPVMISKHGASLMSEEARETLRRLLLPRAYLVTPNIPEAEALAGFAIETEADLVRAAYAIRNLGCANILVKGGHAVGQPNDVLVRENAITRFPGHRIDTKHTHGTGCTYSAAITACLASGLELTDAIAKAKAFIQRAIESAPGIGNGHGPVNHFASVP